MERATPKRHGAKRATRTDAGEQCRGGNGTAPNAGPTLASDHVLSYAGDDGAENPRNELADDLRGDITCGLGKSSLINSMYMCPASRR